jgi:hypothetical protein
MATSFGECLSVISEDLILNIYEFPTKSLIWSKKKSTQSRDNATQNGYHNSERVALNELVLKWDLDLKCRDRPTLTTIASQVVVRQLLAEEERNREEDLNRHCFGH